MIDVIEHITEMPDFENGATALQTSGYFREKAELQRLAGDNNSARISENRAKHALQLSTGSAARVLFILTPDGVGGFKREGDNTSYIGLHTVGTRFGNEVERHEGIHNEHERSWGEVSIPGWDTMTNERKKIIFGVVGIDQSFGERDCVEALTQYATQQRISDTQSGYDSQIVPQGVLLFETLGRKSGRSIIGAFLNMALRQNNGGKQEFADGVRIGGNIIMLEQALTGKIFKVGETAQSMSRIIEEQKHNFVVRDMDHAQRLVDSYLAVVGADAEEDDIALAA